MRLLVTGCAGFICSSVTELLLEDGHSVVGVDSLNNAYDVRLKRWRLESLEKAPNFEFYLLDVTDQQAISGVMEKGPFEAVVNLAARAGVRQSLEDPRSYYEANLAGTLNLLEACRQNGVSKFVLASTSSVYGESKPPFREDASTDRPLSSYAASKKAGENLCYVYHHAHGLDVSVLRYFTVFGPAGRPDMAIYRFIRWIVEGEPIVLYGDGSQARDFTYVGDIARGTVAALKPLGFEVINLGADRPVEVREVIGILERLLEKPAIIQHQPTNRVDVSTTWADIAKAKKLLGWEPKVDLDEGLRRSVDWYLKHRGWAKDIDVWV